MAEELTIDSRTELMAQAKNMGLKPHPATGVEKLKTMIEQAQTVMAQAEGAEDLNTSFDEDQYRKDTEAKIRIEAEAKARVEFEMKPPEIDVKRKPSPEEIFTKTHPKVDIEFRNADGNEITPEHCTWGGVRYLMYPGKQYLVPFGFADHLTDHCKYPLVTQVPDPEAPGNFKPKRTGWIPRFAIRPVDHNQYAKAEEEARKLGYIPIRERQENEET